MIRVLIADDHDIVRAGLRKLLDELPEITLCGELSDASEILRAIATARPTVVVLDINMPGCHGSRTVSEILSLPSSPQVVVFTMYPEDHHAARFLRAGARAFINKEQPTSELIKAIRLAHEGRRYITPNLAEHFFEHQIDPDLPPKEQLSERELTVLRALAEGKRATEVAEHLNLATSTVNTYVQRIKIKLGLRTTLEVVQYAVQNDLL